MADELIPDPTSDPHNAPVILDVTLPSVDTAASIQATLLIAEAAYQVALAAALATDDPVARNVAMVAADVAWHTAQETARQQMLTVNA